MALVKVEIMYYSGPPDLHPVTPGHPDHSLPTFPGHPDQGLPSSPGRPDRFRLPGHPDKVYPLSRDILTRDLPKPPGSVAPPIILPPEAIWPPVGPAGRLIQGLDNVRQLIQGMIVLKADTLVIGFRHHLDIPIKDCRLSQDIPIKDCRLSRDIP